MRFKSYISIWRSLHNNFSILFLLLHILYMNQYGYYAKYLSR